MKKTENPNKKLELVIKDSDLPSLSKDFAEVAVDGILDDGVLRDLPLVGAVIGVIKFGNSINKYLSAKKIYKFLFELHKIPQEDRIKKIDEINNSKKYQSSVGEMIFELLDRIESDGKPEIIGKMFAAVIEEKIDFTDYLRCAHIVKNFFYYDLVTLKNGHEKGEIYTSFGDGFFDSGLVIIGTMGKNETRLSELGKIIIEIGMK
ncbi:hypothetical protein QSV08_07550 [Maribacter sp. BPC-D8]|uniref:hypothetical protein n=1 Tax=Maribacter sp. BPC-D8 TaxID=3053613 RepID=UPI002B49E518|nr:hypothetical protein [Maribacter sp. BPC-D8]WRI31098.1 hypothetical protein QSV08_07550 [Maribacter sp. BPC-D8]